MHAAGQIAAQEAQPIHSLMSNSGFSHSLRFCFSTGLLSLSKTAPTGQTRPQALQSIHKTGSIICFFFCSPLIAWTGHTRTHAVQPIHLSLITWAIELPHLPTSTEDFSVPEPR